MFVCFRLNYRSHARRTIPSTWHANILPAPKSHQRNYLRVVVAIKKRSTNRIHVLLSERTAHHFPTVELNPGRSIHTTLRKFLIELFGSELPQHRPSGVLCVEHGPTALAAAGGATSAVATDGLCLTVLVAVRPPLEDVSLLGKCVWQEVSKEVDALMVSALVAKNASVELHVVR